MSPALAGGFFTTSATWEAPLPPPTGPKEWKEVAATPLGIPAPLKQPWCSLHRTLEPLETEGAARSMLSSFLPPVPSLPCDPPEHFPLRKTGAWTGQQGPPEGLRGKSLGRGSGRGYCLLLPVSERAGREGLGQRPGGRAPSDPGAPAVSEPNLKLRYKPKKSLERRKNPLLRKESAPPSLRRRPAETLGGEARQGGWVAGRPGALPQGPCGWLSQGALHTCQGVSWG